MEIGGSLRFNLTKPLSRDNTGPIYVALPFVHTIANQMVSAIEAIARKGAHKFIVSDHPMNPYPLKPTPGIERAPGSLGETDGVAAVLYAATTVGLEALIGGLPVLRFIPEDNASVDVIPTSFNVEAAWAQNLPQKLMDVIDATIKVAPADSFFHPPDRAYWLALCDE